MTTTPLRPDVAHRATLGRWLRIQSGAISAAWLASIQTRRSYTGEGDASAIAEGTYFQLYDSLAVALETGRYAALDDSIALLTETGYEQGYQLNDLLVILSSLKTEIWQAIMTAYPADEALMHLRSLDALFQTALVYQARVFAELTQRVLAVELTRTREQLEKLDQTKSRFISIAAHELKTPLTLIQGYSDMLNRELGGSVSEPIYQALQGLSAGARRLLATVNDMIAVSLIDAQSLQLNYQLVSLPHILQIVLNDLRANLDERTLYFKMKAIPPELRSFYGDPQRLYQVFDYVIGNAVKYTPDGGSITISLHLLDAPQDADRFVEVRIADSGIGIAPEDLVHIFEKFYSKTDIARHSSSRTKFKGGGTGLGLSVVKGIVEGHGGRIIIESPGYDEEKLPGTTVRIFLPVRYDPPPDTGRERLGLTSDTLAPRHFGTT
ncbi:MAG: HAMP domain-containing sensor histidine kinase [Anaerolineae bacterium]